MALFNGNKRQEGSRSNTALIKSGHMSPAEKWLLDPKFLTVGQPFNEGVLFTYAYGGTGQEDVVIPKGRVVGVATPVKDFVTKKMVTTMTLPGFATGANTVGMVPYNITKDYLQQDRFGGNPPSIITLDYVTLPYIPGYTANGNYNQAGVIQEENDLSVGEKMPWGAVVGAGIKEGDYLKATPSGRLTKWDSASDKYQDVVGQVLATDFNQEQFGWMKWLLWNEAEAEQDDPYINRSGSSNLPSDNGYPFDPKFAQGDNAFEYMQRYGVSNPTGIPGLHDGSGNYDGYGRNDTAFVGIKIGDVPEDVADDTLMAFQVKDYAGGNVNNLKEVTAVKIGGVVVADASRITINYKSGVVTVKLMALDAAKAITIDYKSFFYGTPSYLDFRGVVGSMFVLLKK